MFFEDYPISFLDEDRLGRSDFAESLAQAILNYGNENCLTISLMGKWGSGKSSIINMVKNYWNKKESNNIIVDFNPWYFSNRDNLFFQFFNELSNVSEKDFTEKINKDNLIKLGKSLINMTSFSLNFGLGSVSFDPEVNNELNDRETLMDLKNKISDEFENLDKKVIIIIDDIDRLSDNEIKQILMLVKSLADFPNVIYILLFDKEAVVGSLTNIKVYAPNEFIEKIIQIPLVVPEIRKSQLDNIVLNRLGEFYESNYIGNYLKKDFLDIYSYLRLFFDNLRDLYRYMNIINFYFSVFKDDVNINDFMLILALQLFEHKIYNEIKINKDLFLVLGENSHFRERESCRNELKRIRGLNSKLSTRDLHTILLKLFPNIKNYCSRNSNEYIGKNFKISNKMYFDNYFTLNLENEDLSKDSINELFSLDDSSKISEILLNFENNNQTKELFDIMINRMEDIQKDNAKYFISSLIDVGDLLSIPFNMFFDKRIYLSRILDDLLKKYSNNKERYDVLKRAIYDSNNSLYVAIDFLSDQDFIYNRFDYENDRKDVSEALVDEEDLVKLENMMCDKIRKWDDNGKLWQSEDLEYILYDWENWESEFDVLNRVKEFNSDKNNLLVFAKGFRNSKSSVMHADSYSGVVYKFNIESMVKYFNDIVDLKNKYVEICGKKSLTVDEKEICQSLIRQIDEEF